MYSNTIKGLVSDEVAEVIASLPASWVIEYKGFSFRMPHEVRSGSAEEVAAWRDKIRAGIRGDVDVITEDGYCCGTMPVWTLHNVLSHETFYIRSAVVDKSARIIHNAEELAQYLETTPENIAEHVRTYTDYETIATVDDDRILLQTNAGDTGKAAYKELVYPFSDEAYKDAIVGLQCWADAVCCEAREHDGEV